MLEACVAPATMTTSNLRLFSDVNIPIGLIMRRDYASIVTISRERDIEWLILRRKY